MTDRQEALEEFFNRHPRKELGVDGCDWMYWIGGRGYDTVVLLPGALNSAETGFEHIELLECDFRVIAPTYPAEATSMEALVDGVFEILSAEHCGIAHLVGSGFGGYVAQCMVRKYPERVGKLVLSNTGGPELERGARNQATLGRLRFVPTTVLRYLMKLGMRRAAARLKDHRESSSQRMTNGVAQIRRASFINFYRRSIDFDTHYKFTPADVPAAPWRVLLLESDDEPLDRTGDPSSLKVLYAGAKVHSFDGPQPAALKPQEYAAVVRRFLKGHE